MRYHESINEVLLGGKRRSGRSHRLDALTQAVLCIFFRVCVCVRVCTCIYLAKAKEKAVQLAQPLASI
jgi:hypothetical protein